MLVTGGMGCIGSHTAVALIKNGFEVVIMDNISNARPFILDGIAKITGVKPDFYLADACYQVAVEKLTGVKLNYTVGPRRLGDMAEVYAGTSRANTVLGWKAGPGLDRMILDTWNWENNYRH